jgi:hypothetical protein
VDEAWKASDMGSELLASRDPTAVPPRTMTPPASDWGEIQISDGPTCRRKPTGKRKVK